MDNNRKMKNKFFLAAAAASLAYGFISGKGVFNKRRFKDQHEALSAYVDGNYTGCTYAPISYHGNGWSSAIKRMGRTVVFVYFSKSPDGVYVFTESKQKV